MFKGIVLVVKGKLQKIAIHAAAVGLSAGALVLGNDVVGMVKDLGVPDVYAGAFGAFVGDALRVLFAELRTVDPDFQDPSSPPAA